MLPRVRAVSVLEELHSLALAILPWHVSNTTLATILMISYIYRVRVDILFCLSA